MPQKRVARRNRCSTASRFLTLGPGFSYGATSNRGLHVVQQACCPGLGKANSYWRLQVVDVERR